MLFVRLFGVNKLLLILLALFLFSCSSSPKNDDALNDPAEGVPDDGIEDQSNSAIENNNDVNATNADNTAASADNSQTEDSIVLATPSDAPEQESTEVELTEDEKIDLNTEFKANQNFTYYGIPMLIFRVSTVPEETSSQNITAQNAEDISNTQNNPENNLSTAQDNSESNPQVNADNTDTQDNDSQVTAIAVANKENLDKQKELVSKYFEENTDNIHYYNAHRELPFTEEHQDLLKDFLQNASDTNQKYIILMYVNGSSIRNWSGSKNNIDITMYSQYIATYVEQNTKNIRLEKRYIEDVPEDEIVMIMTKYEGDIPTTIYNAPKGNTLRWLEQYRELEAKRAEEEKIRRRELDQLISTAGRIGLDVPSNQQDNNNVNSKTVNNRANGNNSSNAAARTNNSGNTTNNNPAGNGNNGSTASSSNSANTQPNSTNTNNANSPATTAVNNSGSATPTNNRRVRTNNNTNAVNNTTTAPASSSAVNNTNNTASNNTNS